MLDTVNGLPAHVLLLHAVVVLLPIAALMTVLGAAWPAARRRLGVVTPALAFVVLVLCPITVKAGEWLQNRLDPKRTNAAIDRHASLGHNLLPWAIGIFLLALAVWLLDRRYTMTLRPAPAAEAPLPVAVTAAVTVLAAVVAVGASVQLYRIGDSGAHAAWDYVRQLPNRG